MTCFFFLEDRDVSAAAFDDDDLGLVPPENPQLARKQFHLAVGREEEGEGEEEEEGEKEEAVSSDETVTDSDFSDCDPPPHCGQTSRCSCVGRRRGGV